jgi:hypothetical protein
VVDALANDMWQLANDGSMVCWLILKTRRIFGACFVAIAAQEGFIVSSNM